MGNPDQQSQNDNESNITRRIEKLKAKLDEKKELAETKREHLVSETFVIEAAKDLGRAKKILGMLTNKDEKRKQKKEIEKIKVKLDKHIEISTILLKK